MADLTIGPPSRDTDRRGQVLLVTGFALAVTFVGLALVFNSVIYTENLATRSESTTTTDPISHVSSVEDGTEGLIRAVNRVNATNTSDYAQVEQNFTWAFENMTRLMTNHQLDDGQVVDDEFSLPSDYEATVIHQIDEERNFSNVDNDPDWELVDDADGARGLQIFVGEESQLEGNDDVGLIEIGGEPFNMTVEGSGGDTWRLNVSDDPRGILSSDDTLVGIENADGDHVTCGAPDPTTDPFWINVSEGTVAGKECAGLDFASGLDPIERVEFNNASNINGTYWFVVKKANGSVDQGDYGQLPDAPATEPGIWSVDVTVDYESEVLHYVKNFRAIPGENDD